MSKLVVKDNSLIQASYTLGLVEQRLMLLAIVGARETEQGITAETLLTVKAEDYAEHFGVTRQAAYLVLAGAVETLFNRRATVDVYDKRKDRMRPMTVRWVTAMAYEEGEGAITLRFGPEVVPLITRLEENFTSYELQQISELKSAYAIRLYEILMQWKASGKTPILELAEFRNQLGIIESEYQRMDVFKRRVLDIAIAQINEHTDITVTCEQHKTGRVITGFSFKFKPKKPAIEEKKPKPKKPAPASSAFAGLQLVLLKEIQKNHPEITEKYVRYYAEQSRLDIIQVLEKIKADYKAAEEFSLEKTD